jgi:hypothetical protein
MLDLPVAVLGLDGVIHLVKAIVLFWGWMRGWAAHDEP